MKEGCCEHSRKKCASKGSSVRRDPEKKEFGKIGTMRSQSKREKGMRSGAKLGWGHTILEGEGREMIRFHPASGEYPLKCISLRISVI